MRFLNIAQGLLEECRFYHILAKDLNYGDSETLTEKAEEVSKLIEAYIKAIRNSVSRHLLSEFLLQNS